MHRFDTRITGQVQFPRQSSCTTRTALLVELFDQAIEIGVSRSKFPREPISTALGNPLAVRDHLELTGLTRRNDGFNAQAFLDEGRETRDFGIVVLSSRAVNDFNLHPMLQTAS
jgi:hypothetical protein